MDVVEAKISVWRVVRVPFMGENVVCHAEIAKVEKWVDTWRRGQAGLQSEVLLEMFRGLD